MYPSLRSSALMGPLTSLAASQLARVFLAWQRYPEIWHSQNVFYAFVPVQISMMAQITMTFMCFLFRCLSRPWYPGMGGATSPLTTSCCSTIPAVSGSLLLHFINTSFTRYRCKHGWFSVTTFSWIHNVVWEQRVLPQKQGRLRYKEKVHIPIYWLH